MNNKLNELLEAFVLLDQEQKARQIVSSLKEDISIFKSISDTMGFDNNLVFNREVMDILKENRTMDDYLEAIYAYLKTLEDISGKLLNNLQNKDR